MNKTNIIDYWSYEKSLECYSTHDTIALKLADFYSKLYNLNLVNLNLLDETFHFCYWFICKNTGELYFINMIIDGREYQLTKDINQVLTELQKYTFKQINFEINELTSEPKNKSLYLYCITIQPSDIISSKFKLNKYFIVQNIDIEDRSVVSFNKLSRDIRYERRSILLNNKKRLNTSLDEPEPEQKQASVKLTKKQRIKSISDNRDWSNMITASSIRNYMLNDPLIDYLKEYNITELNNKPIKKKII